MYFINRFRAIYAFSQINHIGYYCVTIRVYICVCVCVIVLIHCTKACETHTQLDQGESSNKELLIFYRA